MRIIFTSLLLFINFYLNIGYELSETEVTLSPPLPICESFQACSAEVSVYPYAGSTEDPIIEYNEPINDASLSTTANIAEFNAGEEELMIIQPSSSNYVEGSGEEMIESSGQEPPMFQFIFSSTAEPGTTAFPLYDEFVNSPKLFDYEAQPNTTRKRLCRCGDNDETEDQCNFSNSTNVIQIDESIKLAFCAPPTHHSRCIGRRNLIRIIGQIHESGESIKSVLDTAVFCDCPNGFRHVGIEPWEGNYAFKYQCK